jgi:drug/metabolite transporter (DMT)-like permease
MRILAVTIVVATQALFTAGDVLARTKLRTAPSFSLSALAAPWFITYFTLRQLAMIGQLYILATIDLGRTASLYAAASLLIAITIGILFLKEPLTPTGYLGATLAVAAITLLALDTSN